ncbi:MAG: hypothetical protein FJ399_16975 [Verrucomicrobia bacterium]|nr:hypothetical protein [Verrucomicrobiota bacterium]
MLESTLFQTILGSQMLADLPRDEIIAHFDRTVELIAPAEPILIYLRQDDAAAALHRICERRGRWFVEYLQAEFGSSASGRRTGCNDLDAIIDYFRQRCDLSDELFARFAGRKLIHDNTDADWERQRRAFTDLLGLPPIKLPAPPDRPEQYTGRFRAESGDEWTITASGGNLTIAGDNPSRLVPHGLDRFVIEGLCVELVYERRPADGAIEAFGCFGNLPSLPPRWVKV